MKKATLKTGERMIPENFGSTEEYLLCLRHIFAYESVGKKINKNSQVLEVGCGEGYGTYYLSKLVKKIIGIDVDEETIKNSQKKYKSSKCKFKLYSGKKIPFKDNTFDAIISFQVIEHIQDDSYYLSEIHRVLKTKGIFILTTPNRIYRLKANQRPWNRFHVREYSPYELEDLLKKVFSNVKLYGVRASKDIEKIEKNRVKPNLSKFFRLVNIIKSVSSIIKNKILKNKINKDDFFEKYNTKDFYVNQEDIDESLDLLAICRRN